MACQNHNISVDPLNTHHLFRTRDIDEARHVVSAKFCDHKLIPGDTPEAFETCHNRASGRSLSLNFLRYSSEVAIDPGELTDFYLVQIPLRGHAVVKHGAHEVEASNQTASILNPTEATRMTWQAGCEKLLVQIDRGALHDLAETLTGHHLPHALVFNPEMQLQTAALQRWVDQVWACVQAAQNGAAFGNSAYRFQSVIEEDLMTSLLQSQPNAITHFLKDRPLALPASAVRSATEYIRSNLSDPITMRDIAGQAGCSVRSLQTGFQSSLGCTPKQYLNRQRLKLAHYLLQTAPPGTLVSTVAYDTGFAHLGRFSIAYKEAYGQSPSLSLLH